MLPSNQKCSGTPIEDTVWIDPTPMVVATPAKDTICTGDATSILLTSITTSTNGVEFNYTSIASDASIGGNGTGTLTPGQSITETLTNSDDTQGYVAYTITPWTLDASSNQKCSGTPIEDTVWIDPTPVVVATPAKDTICTGDANEYPANDYYHFDQWSRVQLYLYRLRCQHRRQWCRNPYSWPEHYRDPDQQ